MLALIYGGAIIHQDFQSTKTNIQQDFQSLLNMSHCFQSKKIDPSVRMLDLKKPQNGCEKYVKSHFLIKKIKKYALLEL